MEEKSRKNAYQRGRQAASLWKRFYAQIKTQDSRFVMWAKKHKLPAWTGHIPIASLLFLTCGTLFFGSLIIAGIILFIWALIITVDLIRNPVEVEITNIDEIINIEDEITYFGKKSHNYNYGSTGSNGSDGSTGS